MMNMDGMIIRYLISKGAAMPRPLISKRQKNQKFIKPSGLGPWRKTFLFSGEPILLISFFLPAIQLKAMLYQSFKMVRLKKTVYNPGLISQSFLIMCAFCIWSALIYLLNAFSVLCPLIAIIKLVGVPSKNSFVQNDLRQVCDIIHAYLGLISPVILLPCLSVIFIISSITASLTTSLM